MTKGDSIIAKIKAELSKDDLYSTKDELLLTMLSNTVDLYLTAKEAVEHDGAVLSYTTVSGTVIDKPSASYTVMLEQSKEIFKYLTALYLTPASRKMLDLAKLNKSVNPFDALTKAMAKMADEDDDEDDVPIKEGDNNDNRPF
jgi:phage terminase small subunit